MEILQSLDFDWQYIRGRRAVTRVTIVRVHRFPQPIRGNLEGLLISKITQIYLLGRYTTLLALIIGVRSVNVFEPTGCQVSTITLLLPMSAWQRKFFHLRHLRFNPLCIRSRPQAPEEVLARRLQIQLYQQAHLLPSPTR